MLAANIESGKQSANDWPNGAPSETPAAVKVAEIKIDEELTVPRREEEEEAESDLDAEYDDEIESEFEDSGDFDDQSYLQAADVKGIQGPINARSLTSQPPIQRKRSHDEVSEEPDFHESPKTVPHREGTPPKRARLDDNKSNKPSVPLIDSPPLRQRKRSSEELEDETHQPELQSPKRVKA